MGDVTPVKLAMMHLRDLGVITHSSPHVIQENAFKIMDAYDELKEEHEKLKTMALKTLQRAQNQPFVLDDKTGKMNCIYCYGHKQVYDRALELIGTLFDSIKHGDQKHQDWLEDKIKVHFKELGEM